MQAISKEQAGFLLAKALCHHLQKNLELLEKSLLLSDMGTDPHHRTEVQIRQENAFVEGRVKQDLPPSSSEAFEGLCFPFPSPFLSPLIFSPLPSPLFSLSSALPSSLLCSPFPSPLFSFLPSPALLSPLRREVLTAGIVPKVFQVFFSLLTQLSNLLPAPVGGC